jgi:glycosyltransferase involved in cell wall biosynthesis
VSRFAVSTKAEELGGLTLSMLAGTHGHQAKEVEKLVSWLDHDVRPELVTLTNVLLSGIVPALKQRLRVPVLAWLQGDDIFLESLPQRYRTEAVRQIRENCSAVDGYLVTSRYYADFMAEYLGLPRERMHVVYPGLNLKGHGGERPARAAPPFVIGYFARICREKGFHNIAEAFRLLCQSPGAPDCRLRVSGWLGPQNRPYFDECLRQLREAGLGDRVEHVESPTHADKVNFLRSIDVLSVPTTYHEPKGLYVLEALANGVPVVQPRHGSFPELIEATGGGLLVNPDDPADLAAGLRRLLVDVVLREELGRKGKEAVFQAFDAATMSRRTAEVFGRYIQGAAS